MNKKLIQQVQGKRVYSEVRNQKKKKDNNSDFYFDDCYICQETKKAEKEGKSLNVEKLKEVFRKANESNWYMLHLTSGQIEKLSNLFLDVAKGLFLGAFALPVFTNIDFLIFMKTFTMGTIFTFFSLKLVELKEV